MADTSRVPSIVIQGQGCWTPFIFMLHLRGPSWSQILQWVSWCPPKSCDLGHETPTLITPRYHEDPSLGMAVGSQRLVGRNGQMGEQPGPRWARSTSLGARKGTTPAHLICHMSLWPPFSHSPSSLLCQCSGPHWPPAVLPVFFFFHPFHSRPNLIPSLVITLIYTNQ